MDYKEKIPLILKRLRLVNKKTQPDIARAVNIDLRTYQRYEHGERLVTTDLVLWRKYRCNPRFTGYTI